jgi:hypothetical protein
MVQGNYIGGLFGFTLFAIVLHYFGKSFLKDKLKRKLEFEKYETENGATYNYDYNHKRYLMIFSAHRYKGIIFTKWIVVIFAFISLYRLISQLL